MITAAIKLAGVASVCFLGGITAEAVGGDLANPVLPTAATSVLATALSDIDVTVMQSHVATSLFKGEFGEAHMNRYLTGYLRRTGNWQPVRSRIGQQGIDGIHIKYDSSGRVRDMLVTEAKYGSSQLGNTKDGPQLGARWTTIRLQKLAREYRNIANGIRSGKVDVRGMQNVKNPQRLQIPLRNGKAAVFWRRDSSDPWKFAGPNKLLLTAQNQTERVARYFDAAANGNVPYRKYVYRVKVTDDGIQIAVKDARNLDSLRYESRLPIIRKLNVALTKPELGAIQRMSRDAVKELLRSKFPHMNAVEIQQYADDITRSQHRLKDLFNSRTPSVVRPILVRSATAGVVAAIIVGGIEITSALADDHEIDYARAASLAGVGFVSGTGGAAAGQATVVLVQKSPVLYRFANQTASRLGFNSTALLTRGVGAFVGGSVASAIASYGLYVIGEVDLKTANRFTIASTAGVAAGFAFTTGTTALIMAYGTASTGTAISTLGGVAATNATLAWLGGGSLAAGGGGMATGAMVLSGGTFIVVVAAGAVVMEGFQMYDSKLETRRIGLTIDELKKYHEEKLNELRHL